MDPGRHPKIVVEIMSTMRWRKRSKQSTDVLAATRCRIWKRKVQVLEATYNCKANEHTYIGELECKVTYFGLK